MEKKIGQLIMFIEREAVEKVAEIDASADDEFHDTVYQLVNQEKKKIRQQFEKQEKAVLKANVLAEATVKNGARLNISKLKSNIVDEVFAQAEKRVIDNVGKKLQYRNILKILTLQSLTKLIEPRVLARVRKDDYNLMKGLADEVKRDFEAISLVPCHIRVDGKYFLPDSDVGGVVIYATTGQKKVTNTLKYRLALIREKMLPAERSFDAKCDYAREEPPRGRLQRFDGYLLSPRQKPVPPT